MTNVTALDAPRAPDTLHPVFVAYVRQFPPNDLIWRDGIEILTAAQVLDELESNSPTGIRYAETVLLTLYEIIRKPLRARVPSSDILDVTTKFCDIFTPIFTALKPKDIVWKTMSGNTTAAQMIELFKTGHDDAIHFLEGRLALAHDILAIQATP